MLLFIVLTGLGWVLPMRSVRAAEVVRVNVSHDKGHYRIGAEAFVALPPDRVKAGIVDVDNLERLSSDVLESRLVERKAGNRLLARMDLRSCILFFCLERTLNQTVIIKEWEVVFIVHPAKNGFRSGWVRWKIFAAEQGTRVIYSSELVPDFWIPPMIGPFLLKGKFHDNTAEVMEKMEEQFANGDRKPKFQSVGSAD